MNNHWIFFVKNQASCTTSKHVPSLAIEYFIMKGMQDLHNFFKHFGGCSTKLIYIYVYMKVYVCIFICLFVFHLFILIVGHMRTL